MQLNFCLAGQPNVTITMFNTHEEETYDHVVKFPDGSVEIEERVRTMKSHQKLAMNRLKTEGAIDAGIYPLNERKKDV